MLLKKGLINESPDLRFQKSVTIHRIVPFLIEFKIKVKTAEVGNQWMKLDYKKPHWEEIQLQESKHLQVLKQTD